MLTVQTAEWHYYLGDAQLSVRQLVDESGAVTQARTYGPYGVLLHQAGDGSGLFGYKGGQSGTNGLWYFGDGYFDPQTGQFLATNGNPLLPLVAAAMVNPAGLLLGPVLLINWRRRKGKKRVHPTTFLLLGILLAAGISSCTPIPPTGTPGVPTPPPTGTSTPMPTVTVTTVATATSTATVVSITATPTCTSTPIPPHESLGFHFVRPPLDLSSLDTSRDGDDFGYHNGVQGFGNTSYAATNPFYAGLGGNHNGIDFAAAIGTPVYSNIDVDATVKISTEGPPNGIPDANPKVILEFLHQGSKVWIIYGHINATVADGSTIPAGERR